MLTLKNVSKNYNKGSIKAVDNLSLDIKQGEIFGFLGPNGAGKTTTIKMIVGLLEHDEGTIEINEYEIDKSPIEAKRQFGYVPDTPQIYERLTGLEYLNFLGDIYKVPVGERTERIRETAGLFELEDALGDPIQSYSHGMQQKIVLMGSILHRPPLWVLDEPMVGLDPKSAHNLKQLMREHCSLGNSVFFSTHVLEVAEKLCDRIGIIRKGQLVFSGTLDELRGEAGNKSLENLFLELTDR